MASPQTLQSSFPSVQHSLEADVSIIDCRRNVLRSTAAPTLSWGAGDNAEALQALTTSTSIQPQHPKATLALGSVLQDNLDLDGALQQYRIAAAVHPNVPQVRCSAQLHSGSKVLKTR